MEEKLKGFLTFSDFVLPVLGGITKREYFAGLAMMGLMDPDPAIAMDPHALAVLAVRQADELVGRLQATSQAIAPKEPQSSPPSP